MAWARGQRPPQNLFHPIADGAAFTPGLAADLLDQRRGKFDCKNDFCFRNNHRLTRGLGLLQVTIGLTPGDAVSGDELA